ncbi:O-antigen ligase [Aureimonas sp. AU4]|uniref:O-antigen ligase family protein n=1 Tax=Aureimonas sp. AU4 TaxID=1638163 RepID=UPI000706BCA5|nr:O-antigen ligase [Aureimonas sp. AU4]BAT30428.1 putative exopolysaccharide production protein, exoQ [Aureimonas sp. AU4]
MTTLAPERRLAPHAVDLAVPLRTAIAALVLSCLLVSFQPFVVTFEAKTPDAGSPVNQLGYGLLMLAGILSHLTLTPPALLRRMAHPVWLLMGFWLVFASFHSPWPDVSLRAVAFTLAAMIAATAVFVLPPDAGAFRVALATAVLAVLGLSYAGIVLLPSAAIHQAGELESIHAGLWRGIYSHKNVAGPVMACLCYAGFYLFRCGWRGIGGAIALLSAFFVLETGSKTTLALLPAVALLVLGARRMGRVPAVLLLALALSAMAAFTLGTVLSPALYAVQQWVLPGTTLTGRLDLWRFALQALAGHEWLGMGFDSFWTTPAVAAAEVPLGSSWDPRGIVNAHSGYLDLVIAMGWPGLVFGLLLIVALPLRDFTRARADDEARRLADLFLMVLAFTLLNAFVESFLFARNAPVWMLLWLSVAGLRFLTRQPQVESSIRT